MFAGMAVQDRVLQQSNSLDNLINIQSDAHTAYDGLRWGIESRMEGGMV